MAGRALPRPHASSGVHLAQGGWRQKPEPQRAAHEFIQIPLQIGLNDIGAEAFGELRRRFLAEAEPTVIGRQTC